MLLQTGPHAISRFWSLLGKFLSGPNFHTFVRVQFLTEHKGDRSRISRANKLQGRRGHLRKDPKGDVFSNLRDMDFVGHVTDCREFPSPVLCKELGWRVRKKVPAPFPSLRLHKKVSYPECQQQVCPHDPTFLSRLRFFLWFPSAGTRMEFVFAGQFQQLGEFLEQILLRFVTRHKFLQSSQQSTSGLSSL